MLYYNIALPALVLFIRAAAVAVAMCRTCCSLYYRSPPLHSLSPIRTCYAHTYSRTTHDNQPYKHHRHHARKCLFTASAARPKSLYAPILRFTPAQPRGVVKSQFAVILDNIGLYVFFSQPYLIYVCRLITSSCRWYLLTLYLCTCCYDYIFVMFYHFPPHLFNPSFLGPQSPGNIRLALSLTETASCLSCRNSVHHNWTDISPLHLQFPYSIQYIYYIQGIRNHPV